MPAVSSPPGAGWQPDLYVGRGDFPSGGPSGLPARLFLGRPAPPLRDYVAGYLGFPPDTFQPPAQVILPREVITVPFTFGDAPGHVISGGRCARLPAQAVFGPYDRAFWFRPQPSAAVTVALTLPGAHALFGISLREIACTASGAADLLGRRAPLLAEQLAAIPGWAARFALLDRTLAAWLARGSAPAPAVLRAWRRLGESGGRLRISDLAAELGTSRRYLEKQFEVQVGLTPKTAARVVRFNAAARLIAAGTGRDLAGVASASGYSDHAHLDREFRELAGRTPTEFLSQQTVLRGVSARAAWK